MLVLNSDNQSLIAACHRDRAWLGRWERETKESTYLANVPVDQLHLQLAALSVPRRVGKLLIVLVFFVRVGHDGGRIQLDLADLKHETVVNTPNVKLIATRQRQTQRAVVRLTQRTLSPPQRMAKIAHPKMM